MEKRIITWEDLTDQEKLPWQDKARWLIQKKYVRSDWSVESIAKKLWYVDKTEKQDK